MKQVHSSAWYHRRLEELERQASLYDMEKKVREKEMEIGIRPHFKKPSWSKLLMGVMVIICLQIVIFSEIVMFKFRDLSALYALVGVAASLSASIWAYCEKSKKENTKGGIVYDMAMKNTISADEEPEG